MGTCMLDSRFQSRVREMAMVLSSAPETSLLREGKERCVTVAAWCSREPSSLLGGGAGASGRGDVVEVLGVWDGAEDEIW